MHWQKTTLFEISILFWSNIGEEGAKRLADMLKVNSSLKKLRLGLNEIGDAGAESLSDVLKVNQTLHRLSLGGNKIGDEGAQSLADMIKVNSSLKVLDLFGNYEIGNNGAKYLASALNV